MLLRIAEFKDLQEIYNLILDLAKFENQPNAVEITLNTLEKHLFREENPKINCFVMEQNNQIIGIALYYFRFSTWKGKTIHLEDLIVKDGFRKLGIGKKLFDEVIKTAHNENVGRMEWEALNWNSNALRFYEKAGTNFDKDWILCKLEKNKLENYYKNQIN